MVGGKKYVLRDQNAINLWLKGRDVWNEWVKKHPVADVSFSGVNFSEYRSHSTIKEDEWPFAHFVFPTGHVGFDGVSFGKGDVFFNSVSFGEGNVFFNDTFFGEGDVDFSEASFGEGRVEFSNVAFGKGDVSFFLALFDGEVVNFDRVSFGEGDVSFEIVDFKGLANFSNLQNVRVVRSFSFAHSNFRSSLEISADESFGCVVDLTSTKMSNQVSLENLQCDLKKSKTLWGSEWLGGAKACDVKDIARFRRLKEIAGNNKDHEQALNFNVMEMQAKRWHQNTGASLFLEFIFQKSSDYGRSEFRPFMWMVAVWSLWSWFYFLLSDAMQNSLFDKIFTAVTFSVGQMIPFVPISRAARSDGAELLFPGDQLPNAVIWLASFQSVISIILIFLIGLSLRNRFKV